jgi:hypothetical protein
MNQPSKIETQWPNAIERLNDGGRRSAAIPHFCVGQSVKHLTENIELGMQKASAVAILERKR